MTKERNFIRAWRKTRGYGRTCSLWGNVTGLTSGLESGVYVREAQERRVLNNLRLTAQECCLCLEESRVFKKRNE